MISFFRRALNSPLVLGLLALIAIAFIVTGIGTPSGLGTLGGTSGSVAKVGGKSIGEADVIRRVQTQFDASRREKPGLDMASFVAEGAVERTIEQMINAQAIAEFGERIGLVASRRLVDGAIASIPAFNGPGGTFDRTVFLGILAQRKIPEGQLRKDFAHEAITKMLLIPATGAARVPAEMVAPYATLLLEGRAGQVAAIPSGAFAKTAVPDGGEVTNYYSQHLTRYTVPERRIVRYAAFGRDRVAAGIIPIESEIVSYFKSHAAQYAGTEQRSFTQIILADQKQAQAIAQRLNAGASMENEASAAGVEPLKVPAIDAAGFTRTTDALIAANAFKAAKGSLLPVMKSGLGFHLIRVDDIVSVPGRTLVQARPEIVATLTKQKSDAALAELVAKIEDAVSDGGGFDEVTSKFGLGPLTTPPLTAAGAAPDQPDFSTPPELASVLRDAFQADPEDEPAVTTIVPNERFALYHLDKVVPAAPRPLAQVRDRVFQDAALAKASAAARAVANRIAEAVNKGTPVSQAIAAVGLALPAPATLAGRRLDLARSGQRVPPPLALLFSMAPRRAKVLAMPDNQGWFVVYLAQIDRGDVREAQPLIAATQIELSRIAGDEYAAQYVEAIRQKIGVRRNPGAAAAIKATLAGGSAGQ